MIGSVRCCDLVFQFLYGDEVFSVNSVVFL